MSEAILRGLDDGVLQITLNRPHRRNAFTRAMLTELAAALREAAADERVRIVVLTGAGGAFCSGADLDEQPEKGDFLAWHRRVSEQVHPVARAIEALDRPVIAAVDGAAVGAGMDFALMCDIRIASDRARFAQTYVDHGLVPGNGGAYLLPRIVGQQRALELLWTGRFVDAEEALRWGLVLAVHEEESFADEVHRFAAALAAKPTAAVAGIKRLVRSGTRSALPDALSAAAAELAVAVVARQSSGG